MNVATLLEPTVSAIRAAIQELDPVADAFEIRFDAFQETASIPELRTLTQKPLIGTVRRKSDGGHYAADEHPRLEILESCLQAGFEFVDVEGPTTVPGPEEKMIRSRHELHGTPSAGTIARWGREISRNGAVFKLASRTQGFADTMSLLAAARTLQREQHRFALMGLGEFPRALTRLLGAEFVYGGGRVNAPGQPSLASIHATLRHWGNPGPTPTLYLVVGSPVDHSLSPLMHNAAFRDADVSASYGALEAKTEHDLQMLLEHAGPLGLGGLSVTTPLKDAAYELVDEKTQEAEAAAAVNCVTIKEGKSIGHNTDGLGALQVVQRLTPDTSARILVAGSGGAGRALVAALKGRDVTIAGRAPERLAPLARKMKVPTMPMGLAASRLDEFDLLVNATRADEPFALTQYRGALFDLHYAETPTPWEVHAKKENLPYAAGRELLLEQGILAFQTWTGKAAPRDTMRRALEHPA